MIFISSKPKKEVIMLIQSKAEPYNLINVVGKVYTILFREKKENIYIIIPWRAGVREFKGSFYEKDGELYLEGDFVVPKKIMFLHSAFYVIVMTAWIIVFLMFKINFLVIPELLRLFLFCVIMISWDVWYIFKFRNKKSEAEIINFINCCI